MWAGVLLAEQPRRDALEAVHQRRQSHFRRVVNEQVHVIGISVELDQLGPEAVTDLDHDVCTAGEDLVGEHPTPVLRHEDQMRMKAIYDTTAPSDVGIRFPAR